jgi:hypothetical protein
MADTAAHLVDRVLPEVPIRQWVLSLPYTLRFRLAYDSNLVSAVLHIFVQAVFASLRRRTKIAGKSKLPKCGAVVFIQRFGDAMGLNLHFHMLALDARQNRRQFSPLTRIEIRNSSSISRFLLFAPGEALSFPFLFLAFSG